DLRLPGERRVRDAGSGGRQRLARARRGDDGIAARVQARRRRRSAHLLRAGRRTAAAPTCLMLSPRHAVVLVLLTLVWGVNWPGMKGGVTGFPPLTFRALSMVLGLPVLGAALLALRLPLRIPREH